MHKISAVNHVCIKFKRSHCCGCGVCAGICPTHAITMVEERGLFRPNVDQKLCTSCGLCRKVCPGIDTDIDELNCRVFGNEPPDKDMGNYINCYTGFSNDQLLRKGASAGGLVSELLRFLFEHKEITCAAVVRIRYGDNIRAESFLARNIDEVLAGKGSKYCPAHLANVVRELMEGEDSAAIVCLPCQAMALRKAMLNVAKLKGRIKYIISLFCSQCPSYHATDEWVKQAGLSFQQISQLLYRGGGWPGVARITTKEGKELQRDYRSLWSNVLGSGFYTPPYCADCRDFFGEFADVSVGDAWLEKFKGEKAGISLAITRTLGMDKLLNDAQFTGKLALSPVSTQELKSACALNLALKKDIYSEKFPKSLFAFFLKFIKRIKMLIGKNHRFLPKNFWVFYNKLERRLIQCVANRKYKGYFS